MRMMKLPKDLGGSESFGMRFTHCACVRKCECVCLWAPVKRGRLQKGSGVRGGGVTNVNGITNYCISVCRESGDGQNAQFTGNKLWCFETCQLLLTIYYWFFIWTRKHCEFYFKNIIILDSCFLFFKGKEYDGIIVLVS